MLKFYIELIFGAFFGIGGLIGSGSEVVLRAFLVASSVLIALALHEYLKERKKHTPHRFSWSLTAGIILTLASLLAPVSRSSSTSNLVGTIETVSHGPIIEGTKEKTIVSMIVTIQSTGARSTAENYQLDVKLTDGSLRRGKLIKFTKEKFGAIYYTDGRQEFVEESDSLSDKTFAPIEIKTRGRLIYEVDITIDEMPKISEYLLTFGDINHGSYLVSRKVDNSGPYTHREFAGLAPRFRQ